MHGGSLASSRRVKEDGGEAFESAAQAINQRKRYDKALTLFDDMTKMIG
jgi:hypothetical protein